MFAPVETKKEAWGMRFRARNEGVNGKGAATKKRRVGDESVN